MKQQIVRIGKLQSARIVALIQFIISVPLAILSAFNQAYEDEPIQWGAVALFPVMYLVLGFAFAFLAAWLYNGMARYLGGIEFTVVEVNEE